MKILHLGLCCCEEPTNGWMTALKGISSEFRELSPGTPNFNQHAMNIAREMQPDLIWMQIQAPNILTVHAAKELAKTGFVMNFTGDIRVGTEPWYLEIGQHIQLTAFSNMRDVENCRAAGVKSDFLNYGFDPLRYNKFPERHPIPEIVFFGNNYPGSFPLSGYRMEAVNIMRNEFKERFGVFGVGWGANATGNLNGNQKIESEHYNSCKIALNISHFSDKRYASDRILRIMGSGTFCLSHNWEDLELDYTPGEDIIVFKDFNDMVEKCHHYLINDTERQRIADNGYRNTHAKFNFQQMAQNVLKLYNLHKQ